MRVTNVVMYSGETEVASFALGLGETPDRYLIIAMSGIDVDSITPRFYSFGQRTGSPLFDFGLQPREMVFRIALNPKFLLDETFSELRERLYKVIAANRNGKIRIQFNAGSIAIAQIEGFIVKLEGSHFTKSPEVQLTIRCDDPFFRGISPTIHTAATGFGLPNLISVPDSLSTAPHGFLLELLFSDDVDAAGVTIQDSEVDPEWVFTVFPPGGMMEFDILQLSTEANNKYVQMVRGGITTPIADSVGIGSVWPLIFPGANSFYIVELGWTASYTITSYPAYWGI